jgi:hypothetical protein
MKNKVKAKMLVDGKEKGKFKLEFGLNVMSLNKVKDLKMSICNLPKNLTKMTKKAASVHIKDLFHGISK